MRILLPPLISCLLLGAVSASAAEDPTLRGNTRFSALTGVSFSRTSAGSSTTMGVNVGLSSEHFLLRGFALGPLLTLSYADGGGARSTQFSLGMNVSYSLWLGELAVPYLFAAPGFGLLDTSAADMQFKFQVAGGAGVHFMLNPHVGFGLAFVYNRFFGNPTIWTISTPLNFVLYL